MVGGARVQELLGDGPDLAMPHGFGSLRTWAFVVELLGEAVGAERLGELVTGTAIVGYRDGEVTVAALDPVQAERLATTYRDLVERKLSEAMRRPVRLAVLTTGAEGWRGGGAESETRKRGDGETGRRGGEESVEVEGWGEGAEPEVPVFLVSECGLASPQVWAAVLEEVVARGDVSRANVDAWLRTTALIGRGDDGAFVVGAPHALARRRIATRFLPALRAAVEAVIGVRLPVAVVVGEEWLRAQPAAIGDADGAAVRAAAGA